MKEVTEKKQREWIKNSHGQYTELADEKEFFKMTKKSRDFVCHFYGVDNKQCRIVDRHLEILAPKHMEARFCKMDSANAPFLTRRLLMQQLPTILLVKDAKIRDFIVGLSELGKRRGFATERMELRIAQTGIIECKANPKQPPNRKKGKNKSNAKKG